jgi:hypothetical protein
VLQRIAAAELGRSAGHPRSQHGEHLVPEPRNRHLPSQRGASLVRGLEAHLSCLQRELVRGRWADVRLRRRLHDTRHHDQLRGSRTRFSAFTARVIRRYSLPFFRWAASTVCRSTIRVGFKLTYLKPQSPLIADQNCFEEREHIEQRYAI